MAQTLYRLYRSRTLDELLGQDHVVGALKAALERGQLSHAYLFSGPRGVGKTSAARLLAHLVNEFDYDEPCRHLDIIEIDAASNRRIEEARELRQRVMIAPAAGNYKAYIVDEVHMLTKDAFNALLKTLEEPPSHAIFILATTEPHKLPATIISRTQHFAFRPLPLPLIAGRLSKIAAAEKLSADTAALEVLAELADGSMRDALSLLEQFRSGSRLSLEAVQRQLGFPAHDLVARLYVLVAKGDTAALATTLNQALADGTAADIICRQLAGLLRRQAVEPSLEPALDATACLNLARQLLAAACGEAPAALLEIALLEAAIPQMSSSNSKISPKPAGQSAALNFRVTQPPAKTKAKGDAPIPSSKITNQPTTAKNKPLQSAADPRVIDLAAWPQILDDIKPVHSRLYALLRLAKPELKNGQLCLTFQYRFHQQRLSQSMQSALKDALSKRLGSSPIITTRLQEPTATTPVPPADHLKNISNIFGGAKMIE